MGADTSCVLTNLAHESNETSVIKAPTYGPFSNEKMMCRFPDQPNIGTIYELFEYTKTIAPDTPYYGKRVYRDGKWQDEFATINRTEFAEMRDSVGSFLLSKSLKYGEHVGIMSYNRIEWVVVQHACYAYGFVPTPIYDTFGLDNIRYIINHAEIHYIFIVSTKLPQLMKSLTMDTVLTDIIVFDAEEEPFEPAKYTHPTIRFHRFQSILDFSERFPQRPPTPDTPASLMYTSGTTGVPKGCLITHANYLATASCYYSFVYPFQQSDSMLSYLPLAHVYESVLHVVATKCLGLVVFYSGSIPRLVEEIRLFKPTVFVGVTRVFERVLEGIQGQIAQKSFLTRTVFNTAFSIKSFITQKFRVQHVPLLDKVFDQVAAALGGRVRMLICGGSALSAEAQNFLRIACNVAFIQGYGLTESTAGTTVQKWTDVMNGNVGVLLQCSEAKLRDLTDQGYLAKDLSGELLIRGQSIFAGYYNDEEATKEVFDNGWFKTGDIFHLNETGQFTMIGRAKELIKLSQGEYISLNKLTTVYQSCKYINQIFIYGSMTSRFLVAIVVIDNSQPGFESLTPQEIIRLLDEKAKEANLAGFEKIKAVHLTTSQFTTENGMMTPSMKLCRPMIQRTYQKELDQLEHSIN